MDMDFSSVADDFFINLNLQTSIPLPDSRETVLHFFEQMQKEFRSMTNLYQRDNREYVLEGDRDSGNYQWVELHLSRLVGGYFNPPDTSAGYKLHQRLLERSFYFLGVSGLDVECLDLLFGFNLDYRGNRDEIVSRALLDGSAFGALTDELGIRCIESEPAMVIALSEDYSPQVRVSVETRGGSYQARTGDYDDQPISVYLTVRAYPRTGELFDPQKSFVHQCEVAEDLASRIIVPNIIQPLLTAIATAQ